jgi:hypothetical protein
MQAAPQQETATILDRLWPELRPEVERDLGDLKRTAA